MANRFSLIQILLIVVMQYNVNAQHKNRDIEISVGFDSTSTADTVLFQYYSCPSGPFSGTAVPDTIFSVLKSGNRFHIRYCPPSNFGYYTLSIPGVSRINQLYYPFIEMSPIEPGNVLNISVAPIKGKTSTTLFRSVVTGQGAEKWRCLNRLEQVSSGLKYESTYPIDSVGRYAENNLYDVRMRAILSAIKEFKDSLSNIAYEVLQLDACNTIQDTKLKLVIRSLRKMSTESRSKIDKKYLNDLLYPTLPLVSIEARRHSKWYARFANLQSEVRNTTDNMDSVYQAVSNEIMVEKDQVLLEKRFVDLIRENYRWMPNPESIVKTAESKIHLQNYVSALRPFINLSSNISFGDFTLFDSSNNKVALGDFRGKLKVIDFWFTGCYPCQMYSQRILRVIEKENEADSNIVFISISVDKDLRRFKGSLQRGDYTSSSALNLYTGGGGSEHEIIKFFGIHSYPYPVIVKPGGEIVKTEKNTDLLNPDKLRAAIRAARDSSK
jgi:thiol-disulfide isomerase/thioredoxin